MNLFINQYKNKYRTEKLITISLGDSQNDIEILNKSNYSGIIKNNSFKISNLEKKIIYLEVLRKLHKDG